MRIVAGEFRGRRLLGPPGAGTRPTADRTREAVFSILGDVGGRHVLDLFAGTGALGLEALSRGARTAVFVERDRRMLAVARRNVESLLGERSDVARLCSGDALKYLAGAGGERFDLVFLDPPYARAAELAAGLAAALPAVLAPGAVIVTESDRREPLGLPEPGFALRSEHRYGDTLVRVFDAP
jgi:16S rRNA (guanine966-N2)-methyltransferase